LIGCLFLSYLTENLSSSSHVIFLPAKLQKTSEMQKENLFFFSFPSAKDSKLVSLGLSKNCGEARVTKNSVPSFAFSEKKVTMGKSFSVSLRLER